MIYLTLCKTMVNKNQHTNLKHWRKQRMAKALLLRLKLRPRIWHIWLLEGANAYIFFHPDTIQCRLVWSKCKSRWCFLFWVYPNISLPQTLKILTIICWFHNFVMNSCNYGTSKSHIRSWQHAVSPLKHEHYRFSFSVWKL